MLKRPDRAYGRATEGGVAAVFESGQRLARVVVWVAFVLAGVACKKTTPEAPTPWRFWGFASSTEHQAPIVVRDDEAALVLESGVVGPSFKVSDGGSTMVALGDGYRLVIGEPHAVRMFDVKTGQMHWSAPLSNAYGGSVKLAMSGTSVAVIHSNGAEIFELVDGRVLYAIENHRAFQLLHDHPGADFAIAFEDELRLVTESGSLEWQFKIPDVGHADLLAPSAGTLLVSTSQGDKALNTFYGTMDEVIPLECGHPDSKHLATTIGHSRSGGSYVVVEYETKKEKNVSLVACDAFGEQRWRAPFFTPSAPFDPAGIRMDNGRVVGWIVPDSPDLRDGLEMGHVVLAFNDATGERMPLTRFDPSTHLIGAADSCLLVTRPTLVECVDVHTSQPIWSYARHEHATAWPVGDNEALIFDEDDLSLVRVGTKGERWRTTLRGAGFTADESTAPSNWTFARDYGAWDASDGPVQIVDLVTGSIRTVAAAGA